VQARFLEEWRAGGRPRLSVYARRFPDYAAALAELVAALPPDTPTPVASATSTVATGAASDPVDETQRDSLPGHLTLDEGIQHALTAIFGEQPREQPHERPLPRVAEQAARYEAGGPNTTLAQEPPAPEGPTERD